MRRAAPVKLRLGGLTATVAGGQHLTITSLRHRGQEILVGPQQLPPAYRVHGRRAGITLLHPWGNRLSADAMTVAGRKLELSPTNAAVSRDPNGLAIHGLAAVANGWVVEAAGPTTARATLSAPATQAFPFAHRVEVSIELTAPARTTITTTVGCEEDTAVPVAFAWHPYFHFERCPAAELVMPHRTQLLLDERGLPSGEAMPEEPAVLVLGDRALDRGYCGISDGAGFTFSGCDSSIEVIHEYGFGCAQVFAPLDAAVLSLEPMTAPTDALRTGRSVAWALPEAPYSARVSIDIAS